MNNEQKICFNRCYYDPFRKKFHITETINGQRFSDVLDVEFSYFVEDPKKESPITDIYGRSVVEKRTRDNNKIKMLREAGVFLCESDLSQDVKMLHRKYENINLKPDIKDYQVAFLDIEIEAEKEFPKPSEAKYPINLITIRLSKQDKCYTFGNRPYTGKEYINYKCIPNEKEMLEAFIDLFNKAKVDILSGWYINGFDIPYIINRCRVLGIEKTLSPVGKYWQNQRTLAWTIPGISILDYLDFYKDPKFVQERMEGYTLQFICMYELGEGKIELEGQVNQIYKTNWNKFVEYNIQDVVLCFKLDVKKKFIELCVNIAHKSLIPIDKVFSAVSVIEGMFLSYFHANKMVMNDRNEGVFKETIPGGHVETHPGFYECVISIDAESLYPRMITHYNISPETLVLNPENTEGLIKTPLSEEFGIYYKKDVGVLPKLTEENFQNRKMNKDLKKKYEKEGNEELSNYYDVIQNIYKRFLNSMYGTLLNEYFHYYNVNMAKSITLGGQHLIKYVRDKINLYFKEYFHKDKRFFKEVDEKNRIKKDVVILVDTDSNYLCFKEVKDKLDPEASILEWCTKFGKEFLNPFLKSILDKYFIQFGIENKMNFKIEKIISKKILFGDKNYAVITLANEGNVYENPDMSVTGFSSKRSSTPHFCRKKIDEMLRLFFENPDRKFLINKFKEVKKEFINSPIEDISFPRGISDYSKYGKPGKYYVDNGIIIEKGTPVHTKAGIAYNYIVAKRNLPNQPVDSGSKIKYFYVNPDNEAKTEVMGFLGKCPDYIKDNFKINYDLMFQVSFLQPMQKLFDVMKWGEIDIETKDISEYFEE